jgi:hypothetical protein
LRARGEPAAGNRSFRGLISAIFTLEELPLRCASIPESAELPLEVRQLLYHSHRILFRVEEPRWRSGYCASTMDPETGFTSKISHKAPTGRYGVRVSKQLTV